MWGHASNAAGLINYGLAWLDYHDRTNPEDPIGAVVSSYEPCSKIGNEILLNRGNAADAAIAMAVCIGTVAPYHSGIGGGGMLTVLKVDRTIMQKEKIMVIDFRETAPAAATQDMFDGNETSGQIGGLAVGVPGEVAGLQMLYDLHASKWEDLGTTWKQLWGHSAKLAKEGFEMTEDMMYYYNNVKPSNKFLYKAPWSDEFAPNGSLPQVGEMMRRPAYAKTLETIAEKGAQAFYEGHIADSIVQTVQRAGGIMTTADLKGYKPEHKQPISMAYRDYKLFTAGPPSSAASVLSALKIMEGYPPMNETNRNETTHILVEAIKHAYGMRTKLGDPTFEENAVTDMEKMIDPKTIEAIREKIHANQTFKDEEYYNPQALTTRDADGTAHISAVDKYGFAVSLTTTVNMYFGAQLMDPKTGIILNNEMNDFNNPLAKWEEPAGANDTYQKRPSPANLIKPGKRPLSSMSPIIALRRKDKFAFSLGAAGGAKIITSVLQTCLNIIDRKMTMYNAIKEPRLHHQLTPNELQLETSYDPGVAAFLKEKGHGIKWVPEGRSVVHGIGVYACLGHGIGTRSNQSLSPACDPRKCTNGAWIMDREGNGRALNHPLDEDFVPQPDPVIPAGGNNFTVPYNTTVIPDSPEVAAYKKCWEGWLKG